MMMMMMMMMPRTVGFYDGFRKVITVRAEFCEVLRRYAVLHVLAFYLGAGVRDADRGRAGVVSVRSPRGSGARLARKVNFHCVIELCNLQVKLCDPCLRALQVVTTMRYTNLRILYFTIS